MYEPGLATSMTYYLFVRTFLSCSYLSILTHSTSPITPILTSVLIYLRHLWCLTLYLFSELVPPLSWSVPFHYSAVYLLCRLIEGEWTGATTCLSMLTNYLSYVTLMLVSRPYQSLYVADIRFQPYLQFDLVDPPLGLRPRSRRALPSTRLLVTRCPTYSTRR